jgi:hypothetical protein
MSLSILSPLPDPMKRVNELQREIDDLRNQLEDVQTELRRERQKSGTMERGVARLREALTPVYSGLQMIFGEIEATGVSGGSGNSPTPAADSRIAKVWESWKGRLGEGCAKIIDALLLHGEMNTQQLAIATGYHRTTVPTYIYKLTKAGLINKNGGRFSLKEL